MSTSWELRCLDCGAEARLGHRGVDQLRDVWNHRAALLQLVDSDYIHVTSLGHSIDFGWLSRHRNHRVVIESLDGERDGWCNEWWCCEADKIKRHVGATCGQRPFHCKAPQGHEGPHRETET